MNDVIRRRFQGIHMQVQITSDEQLILFGDKSLKVLTVQPVHSIHSPYSVQGQINHHISVLCMVNISLGTFSRNLYWGCPIKGSSV